MKANFSQRMQFRWFRAIVLVGLLIGVLIEPKWLYAAVGSITAEFSAVNGAATYTVPVQVPAGTAGVQPEISLAYSSMSGPGIGGMGWSLGGFSAITRCGKTIFEDGAFSGVEYSYNDKFCLDGQRLILVGGSYGHDGAEYRTKIESFSRIRSYGSTGNGPEYFVVETKAGQTIEYGRTSDSRIIAAGKSEAFAWAQNRLTDIANNYMTFSYVGNPAGSSTGNPAVTEFYPSTIEYTGNSAAGTAPYASVNFSYIARNDKPIGYVGGAKFQTTKQLDKIIAKYGDETAFEYRLEYTHRDDEESSLLKAITEYGRNGASLPSTSFTWTESPDTVDPTYSQAWATDFPDNGDPDLGKFITGDIDGDGLIDLMSIGNSNEKVYRSTGSSLSQISTVPRCTNCKLTDVNGDGKADIIKVANSLSTTTRLQVAYSNGTGFGAFTNITASYPTFTERDPDGWYDIVYPYPFDVGDVNGDGRADIVTTHTRGNIIYFSNANGSFSTSSSPDCRTKCLLGDFNADGRVDLAKKAISFSGTKVDVALSNGAGFNGFSAWSSEAPVEAWLDFDVTDLNGDGASDLVIFVDGNVGGVSRVLFQKSTGGSFETQTNTLRNCVGDASRCRYKDMNADGLVDFVYASTFLSVNLSPYVDPDLITGIDTGMSRPIKIGYGNLNDSSVHEKDGNTSHPVYPVRSPMPLITSLRQGNGLEGLGAQSLVETTYTYKGLNYNKHGLGSLGFREMTSVNTLSGAKEVESYSQDYPNIGSILESESYKNNVLVSKTVQTSASKTIAHPLGTTILPFVTRSESIEYDLNTAQEIKRLISKQKETDIDQYGNVKAITTITKTPGTTEESPEFKVVNENLYRDAVIDVDTWQLGRLERSTVTQSNNKGVAQERVSGFTYYPSGLLKSEIIAPDESDSCTNTDQTLCIKQTTTYGYDDFGNKREASISGYGITPVRTTTTQYDVNGRFPEWTENALGHREHYTYDPICGKKATLIGPNGLPTSWIYDDFCRLTSESRADNTQTTTERHRLLDGTRYAARPVGTSPSVELYPLANVFYKIVTTTTGQPRVTVYYDQLGRELRKETIGFDNRSVYQDTEYDALGRIIRASRAYYAGDPIYWVNFQYDALDRVVLQDAPGDYNARVQTRTAYNGLVTSVTDPKNRVTTTTKDAAGQVIRVDQPGNAFIVNRYDPYGNLVQTEDAKGNIVAMGYDDRGRKTSMDDPDMGHWEYRYNAVGELIWQMDAKNQRVALEYDELGRMVKRIEPEGVTNWHYDTEPYGIGKLASVSAPGGYSQTVSYDNLGRPKTTTTTINSKPYTVTTDYDDATGRVKQVTRPGGLVVENVYDANGYLLAKRSPASQVSDYDKQHLRGLQDEAVTSAQNALAKAQQYAADAAYYEQWAATYQNEVAQNADVQTLTAEVAALQRHTSYPLYIHQSTGELYLESPDRVMILHGDIDTPIMIPPEAHYKVVAGANSEWTLQAVDLTTWSSSVLPNLADSGEHVFFGDYNGDGTTDYIRSDQSVENPLYDSALLERLAQTASEIQYVSNTLWNLADDALARATQLIAVAGQVEDRLRQAELWAENSDGQDLTEMGDATSGAITYWQANTRDAEHRLTGFRQGNGLVTLKDYDPASGHLMGIQTGFEFGANIRELEYHYDALDNVTSRHDRVQGVSESFQYDSLDRLKQNSVSGSVGGVSYSYSTDYDYDLTGNILYKSDVGHYSYGNAARTSGNAGPAALLSAGPNHTAYQYDLNGNLESGGGRVFQWTSFNKPKRLQKGTAWTEFTYGPDRARYLKDTSAETTVYIGKLYEEIKDKGADKITRKHFIYAGGELAAIQIQTVDSNDVAIEADKTRYLHTDALGSVDTISDGFGNIVDRMGFDPFGMRRAGDWNRGLPLALPALTNRGFTGHEHIDELGIIHMNGRIYDPELGRFLSADPNIQSPLNSQSHNRYSYVMNNPLKYTDPSGYFIKWLKNKLNNFVKKWGRVVFSIAISAFTGWGVFAGTNSLVAAGAAAGAIGGAMATGTIGGALRGGIFGALSAWAAGYIADINVDTIAFGEVGRDIAHGVAQGLLSEAAGGDFKSGFLGAFLGHMTGRTLKIEGTDPLAVTERTIIASVVGGTVAKAGGGKFANGAVSAAFSHLFNTESSGARRRASRSARAAKGSTEMPALEPGAYPIIVDSYSVTAGPLSVELGDIWLIDTANSRVLHYCYMGGGPAAGLAAVASREFGALYLSDPGVIEGFALSGESDGVLVFGGTGTIAIPVAPFNPQSTSFSGGPAIGGGAGVSGIGTYSWFQKVYDFSDVPSRLPLRQ